MSTFTLVLPHRQQAQAMPREQAQCNPRQLDLPIECLRLFRIVVRWLRPRQRVDRLIYFGKHQQFVSVAGVIRRVEGR